MEKLFDDKERLLQRYSKHLEKTYSFYDKTAMQQFVEVRKVLNTWFSRYPDAHKQSLKRDFQSQFESAFFELFIHELFFQQGFTLTPHPSVPNSSKNPDFLAKKGDWEIYLEAKVATDKSNEERTLDNKRGAIYDQLQELKSPDYWINIIEISFTSNKQAKLSKLKARIQYWLDETHLKGKPIYNHYDNFNRECYRYYDKDITIVLSLFESSIKKDQPVASFLGGNYSGGCEEVLSNAIKEKGAKYGQLDKPYILCINLSGTRHPHSDEIYNTLVGNHSQLTNTNTPNTKFPLIKTDGILKNSSCPAYTQVSAFFITRVFELNVNVADHWLIEHPYACNSLNLDLLDLTYLTNINREISVNERKNIGAIIHT